MARTGPRAPAAMVSRDLRSYPLNYAMNVGNGQVIQDEDGPPHIEGSERAPRSGTTALGGLDGRGDWDDLRRTHPRPEGTL